MEKNSQRIYNIDRKFGEGKVLLEFELNTSKFPDGLLLSDMVNYSVFGILNKKNLKEVISIILNEMVKCGMRKLYFYPVNEKIKRLVSGFGAIEDLTKEKFEQIVDNEVIYHDMMYLTEEQLIRLSE